MIVLSIAGSHIRREVGTNPVKNGPQQIDRFLIQHPASILGHEDQVDVKRINNRSAASLIACLVYRPSVTRAMVLRTANTYRLYPTPEQAQQMAQIAGSCRFVYNLALEQRSQWYRPGRKFSFASQCREVTMLRAEVDWL